MKKIILFVLLAICSAAAQAQGTVTGKIVDRQTEEPLGFVNIRISPRGTEKLAAGATTDIEGRFHVEGLDEGDYTLTVTLLGYKTVERQFAITAQNPRVTYAKIYIGEDARQLKEVSVVGQRATMRLEVDRKSYDVSQLIANSGDAASDVLDNIPSVEVDNDGNVSLRGNSSVEVWINGKASGLTSDNRAEILQQLPAESIDHIEVIDNPSAKFSAEGSAGIINIVLKKDRKPGYYGSVQAGVSTRGGANTSFNINYNSPVIDSYFNIGYRHRANRGYSESQQEYITTQQYQHYRGNSDRMGNNLFARAGITWHMTKRDDLSLSGMHMGGKRKNWNTTPYHYGTIGAPTDTYLMTRRTRSGGDGGMNYVELNYRHNFSDRHFLDIVVDFNKWKNDDENIYQDSTEVFTDASGQLLDNPVTTGYSYQNRPMHVNSRAWEVKADYEVPLTEKIKLQTGYQGRFSHENTPQESYVDNTYWDGRAATEDQLFYNRFIYDMDLHAFYGTLSLNTGKFGFMGGLRGEYWRVNTESYDYEQEHDPAKREAPFKKDFFELFPSLFLSYQITPTQQLQLNYTRRLRRPWGGELNSFRNTRDATMISFGNPELTPEYSHSFSLNYLKTWTQHSLLVSAYYRPTTDVMQRISWQSVTDGMMYQTTKNVTRSQSSGLEMVLKNKLWRILDLTTTANAYYYKLNGFSYVIDGQTVTGTSDHNFTWDARMTASLILPYDISVQASGRYNARQVITQGHRKAGYSIDLGARKNFFDKKLTLSVNCRDLLNSRKFENFTSGDTFTRHQVFKFGGRRVNFTLTYNFGNMKQRKQRMQQGEQGEDDDMQQGDAYSM